LTRSRAPKRNAGEAKISGWAIVAGPVAEGPDGDRFGADITEVVHTRLNPEDTVLVVMVDARARAAKDRPRLTVEAAPGLDHEQGRLANRWGLIIHGWRVSAGGWS
jgi:hypothetical protein